MLGELDLTEIQLIESRTCPDCTLSHLPLVLGEGQAKGGGVVAIGEGGGKIEGIEGRPFVGPAGQVIRPYLRRMEERGLGFDYLTNMIPRAMSSTPTAKEVAHSWNCHLRDLLLELRPRGLVAIGSVASTFLTGMGVIRGHGSAWTLRAELMSSLEAMQASSLAEEMGFSSTPMQVFIVNHPSRVVRHLIKPAEFKADMQAMVAWMMGQDKLSRENYTVITASMSTAESIMSPSKTVPSSLVNVDAPATMSQRGGTIPTATPITVEGLVGDPANPVPMLTTNGKAAFTKTTTASPSPTLPSQLVQAELVAVDFETADDEGNPTTDRDLGHIIGVAFCTEPGIAFYYPVSGADEALVLLNQLEPSRTVWYNGCGFDLQWLPDERWRYARVEDVYFLSKVLAKPFGSLKDLAAFEFGVTHPSIKMVDKKGGTFATDDELPYKSCEDVDLTRRLYPLYLKEAASEEVLHIYEMELTNSPIVRRLEDNGIWIDQERLREAGEGYEVQREIYRVAAEVTMGTKVETNITTRTYSQVYPVKQSVGWTTYKRKNVLGWVGNREDTAEQGRVRVALLAQASWNPASPEQLVEWFLGRGVKLNKRSRETKRFSMDREVLEGLDHPLAKLVLKARRAKKMTDFVAELFDSLRADGYTKTRMHSLGTETGRYSSSDEEETAQ